MTSAHGLRLLRFGLVGVVNTVTYYGSYLALGLVLPYLLAHLSAVAVSITGSYFLNCRLTFHVRPSWRTFLLFPLSSVANVVVTTIGLPVAVDVLGIDETVAPIPVQLTALPITYLVANVIMTPRLREPTAAEIFAAQGPAEQGPAEQGPAAQGTGDPNPDRAPV